MDRGKERPLLSTQMFAVRTHTQTCAEGTHQPRHSANSLSPLEHLQENIIEEKSWRAGCSASWSPYTVHLKNINAVQHDDITGKRDYGRQHYTSALEYWNERQRDEMSF